MFGLFCILSLSIFQLSETVSSLTDQVEAMSDPSVWSDLIEETSRAHLIQTGLSYDDGNITSCSGLYSCQDCTTAQVCRPTSNGGYQLLQTIKCTPERPFCDQVSGTCVSTEPDVCGTKDNFVCMGNGKYPDNDCTRFHACIDFQSLTFQCTVEGAHYNARSQICEVGAPCGSFDCTASEGKKVSHSEYAGFFAYCHGENSPLVVDSCPGSYELNVTSQICEPICHREGIQADLSDCHRYFKCTQVIVNPSLSYFIRELHSCPTGQAYSSNDFICVDQSSVPDCQ